MMMMMTETTTIIGNAFTKSLLLFPYSINQSSYYYNDDNDHLYSLIFPVYWFRQSVFSHTVPVFSVPQRKAIAEVAIHSISLSRQRPKPSPSESPQRFGPVSIALSVAVV